jgi:hypothetical protein
MRIRFICLANSRKLAGRCVAGLRSDSDEWIRPVSQDSEGTLLRRHYVLDDGKEAAPLDVIELHVSEHRPKPYQPENWVLGNEQWKLIKRLDPKDAYVLLKKVLVTGPELFGNAGDRVPLSGLQDQPIPRSLALIEPTDVSWHIATSIRGTRQTRALFSLGRASYDLAVTDPVWEHRLKSLDLGVHSREAANVESDDVLLFTISLGGPFQGQCYKLIAGIVPIPKS